MTLNAGEHATVAERLLQDSAEALERSEMDTLGWEAKNYYGVRAMALAAQSEAHTVLALWKAGR